MLAREPDAGNPHVRFDEGSVETGAMARLFRHRQTKGAETDTSDLTSTAPHFYSTRKTVAQGRPGVLGCTCGTCRLHFVRRRATGVSRRPAFPVPSVEEGQPNQQLGRHQRREEAKPCPW